MAMEEIDIWRCASLLVQKYGEEAVLHAARYMDEMVGRGDPDGEAVWKSVQDAIEELRATSRPTGTSRQ